MSLASGGGVFVDVKDAFLKVLGYPREEVIGRRSAEITLRDQNELLANVIDGTGVGIWRWNIQTGETTFDDRWAAMIGSSLLNLIAIAAMLGWGFNAGVDFTGGVIVRPESWSGASVQVPSS